MRTIARLIAVLALAHPLVGTALAQDRGKVKGVIEDPTGAPISQAAVRLTSRSTNQAHETTSNDAGQFEFSGLAFGEYVLKAKAPGFETSKTPVKVGMAPAALLRIRLTVAPASEEVTVTAAPSALVSADQNTAAVDVRQKLYSLLPVKGGDALAVASMFLDPAATGAEGASIVVDGVESSNLDIPLSAIKTIYVNKDPYSAEFARPGRGRVEVVTNKGSEYHYHRRLSFTMGDSGLNARNAFAQTKPLMRQTLVDGEFDGRLPGNQSTFLIGAEYLRSDEGAVVDAETPAGAVVQNVATRKRSPRLFARFDIQLNPKHHLTARYKFKDISRQNLGVGGFNLPEHATNLSATEHQIRISDNAVFSSNFLNEIRFSFQNEHRETSSITKSPAIIVLDAFSGGGAQVSFGQRERSLDFQDVATVIRGRHTFRFGAGGRPRFIETADASNFAGTFTFSSLSDFSQNHPFLLTVNRGDPNVSLTQHEFFYFLQDEIRAGSRFSLAVGLRHELQSNLRHYDNLAPRIGLAYAPGGGRTVFRAGAGIFYDRQPAIMQQQSLLLDGARIREAVFSNPSFPQPPDLSIPAAFSTPSVVRIAPDIRTPLLAQASLGFERFLGERRNSLALDYTMLRGTRLYRMRNINAPLPGTGDRPNPAYVNIDEFESTGSSQSHALTVTFHAAVSERFEFVSLYTFSRTLDDTSGLFSLPANNYDLRGEWGRADYDRRHRFTLTGTSHLFWGLRLGAIATLASGAPFNITTGRDDNGDTVANDRPPGMGRNTGHGPGLANVDLRLSRKFRMGSSQDLSQFIEVRVDVFNAFNHTNFMNFVGTLTSPFFGRANSAYPARELRLSLNIKF